LLKVKLGKNPTETFTTLKVTFGQQTITGTQVLQWFSKFKTGVNPAEDSKCLE
jgi:hypothetical protein